MHDYVIYKTQRLTCKVNYPIELYTCIYIYQRQDKIDILKEAHQVMYVYRVCKGIRLNARFESWKFRVLQLSRN